MYMPLHHVHPFFVFFLRRKNPTFGIPISNFAHKISSFRKKPWTCHHKLPCLNSLTSGLKGSIFSVDDESSNLSQGSLRSRKTDTSSSVKLGYCYNQNEKKKNNRMLLLVKQSLLCYDGLSSYRRYFPILLQKLHQVFVQVSEGEGIHSSTDIHNRHYSQCCFKVSFPLVPKFVCFFPRQLSSFVFFSMIR